MLLAMIATRATHSSLSAEFRKRFWQPLRLTNTYLSMEDQIPQERLAHVWGDNFEKGTELRDITFLPRTSHESITYGSSGIFTTPRDLAVWCMSLFRGKILENSSLHQMLKFNPDAAGSWCEGFGLGVFILKRGSTNGEKAYGTEKETSEQARTWHTFPIIMRV
jgi:CubicO group peptidase (beta-lactamase class C family)